MSFDNSGLNNQFANGLKVFKEESLDVKPEVKPNQGVKLVQDMITGVKTLSNMGEEEGWFQLEKNTSSSDRKCDAWTMISPAMLNMEDELVHPIIDKTLVTDTANFNYKTRSQIAGSSGSNYNHLQGKGRKMAGVLVSCPNHASQETLFVATETTALVRINSPANPNGKGIIPFSTQSWGIVVEGEKLYSGEMIYFTLRYASGQPGIPNGTEIEYNQIITVYSTPQLAGKGVYDWVSFVQFPLVGQSMVIKDKGNETGIPVSYSLGGVWIEYGSIKPLKQVGGGNFHGSIWKLDNLYTGLDIGTHYAVSRPGYETTSKTFTANSINIMVDTAGRVVEVT